MPTKKYFLHVLLILWLMNTLVVFAQSNEVGEQTEILWDVWGVPHIYAPDNEGLFYAFGWAQAHNHGDLILKLYGEARGRAAEYWGESYLESDQLIRTLGIPAEGRAMYEAQSPEWKTYADAFAQGVNDYVRTYPDRIGDEWEAVVPIDGGDIFAHGMRVLRYSFTAGQGIRAAQSWAEAEPPSGSNGWAIGPSRSASGHAMLVANPHQPWSGFGLWIEAHLVTPEFNMYGAALVGNMVLGIAFNEYLGWTHTVNTHDGWDLYALTVNEAGTHYRYDGADVPFDTREEIIRVKNEDGTFSDAPLLIRESIHGPVIAQRDDSALLAIRIVGEGAFYPSQQWFDMGRATSLSEFEAVLARLQIPMFTVIYADRDGNIMHLFNELVPVRAEGDWQFWNGTTLLNRSNPAILPGDSSRYVWTEFHPYEDLPRVVNPPSGWVQNANEPPWTATLPLAIDPMDYPPYIAPPPYTWPRPIRSMRLLYEDESITFEELIAYKQDTYVEVTNALLDDLIAVARTSEEAIAGRAADVLDNWDRRADADSVGAVLFALWLQDYVSAVGTEGVFAVPWSLEDPLGTPRGLAKPDVALEKLIGAANLLESLRILGGGIDVPYGDIFRLRYGDYDLPANGGSDLFGTFRVLTFTQDSDLRFRPVQGDSYIAVIEFGEKVRAKVLLSYGNATQAGSPHVGDQLELFAQKALRDAWLTRAEVEAHLQTRETFDR